MDTLIAGLYGSAPEPLGFGPELEIRAFLLERPQGNLLVYRSASLERESETIAALGGVARQYLNHWHEASPTCDWVAKTFAAPLACHADDAAQVSQACHVAETFADRHFDGDDFEVIPTPGHTAGATAFLWSTDGHRVLFTGDTIFFSRGEWSAAVLASSDRERYLESLVLMRGLDFDVLVPSVAPAGQPTHAVVDRTEAVGRIDRILEQVRDGD